MGFKAMNQVRMKMALGKGDFLEQFGFNKFQFGPLLMKICVFETFGFWLLVNHRWVTSLKICFGKKRKKKQVVAIDLTFHSPTNVFK